MSFPDAKEARSISDSIPTLRSLPVKNTDGLSNLEKCKAGVLRAMHSGYTHHLCSTLADNDIAFFRSKGYQVEHRDDANSRDPIVTFFPFKGTDIDW